VERSAGERGKGFYWTVEVDCERMFEEQEARAATSAAAGGKDAKVGGRKGKSTAALEPPFKRSVRGEPKGTPLPPPLTSTPLVFKKEAAPQPAQESASEPTVKVEPSQQVTSITSHGQPTPSFSISTSSQTEPTATSSSVSSLPSIPASVILPIIVGPVPASHPSAVPSDAQGTNSAASHLSTPPIVLHENQLILNPTIFSHLTPEQLRELEALGAQKALEILQNHIVRFLKERIKTEGRARGRGRGKRTRGTALSDTGAQMGKKEKPLPSTGPFTTTPLPMRSAPPPMDALLPTPSPSGGSEAQPEVDASPPSPIVVVDDDEPSDCPALKRRRLDIGDTAVAV
jgi:forkhead box protein K